MSLIKQTTNKTQKMGFFKNIFTCKKSNSSKKDQYKISSKSLEEDIIINQEPSMLENQPKTNKKYQNLDLSKLLSLKMQFGQNLIKLQEKETSYPVQLSLIEDKLEAIEETNKTEDETSVDIFCVIDVSGSMFGEKIKQVKESLEILVTLLKSDDRISITLFSTDSELILAPKLIGENKKLILKTIKGIETGGATNIADGIETAFKAMLDRKSRNQVTGVLQLSDGNDNRRFSKSNYYGIESFFEEWETKLSNEDYTLHTFGYGDDHDQNLIHKIAKKGGGKFYYVKELKTVADTFVDCLAALYSVIGLNANITIKLNPSDLFPEICFKRTYGANFTGDKETERVLKLDNITKGYKRDFMFEIGIDGVKDPNFLPSNIIEDNIKKLISAELVVTSVNDDDTYKINCQLNVPVSNRDIEGIEIEKDAEVAKNLLRVKGSDAIEDAMEMGGDCRYSEARSRLSHMEKDLDQYSNDSFCMEMKENLAKQKVLWNNEKEGISNEMNVMAYCKNMKSCYMDQESAPQFTGEKNMNKTKAKYSKKLKALRHD